MMIDTQDPRFKQLLEIVRPAVRVQPKRTDVANFIERRFWVLDEDTYQIGRIKLYPHQKTLLRFFLHNLKFNFQTKIFSTIKKSGKTTLTSGVARYVAEQWGVGQEVLCLANDLEQARGRIFNYAVDSIKYDPAYDKTANGIPGEWYIVKNEATYLPAHNTLKAVSLDYRGEAGSNPTATFWSELWGYTSEGSKKFWAELTPPPTRKNAFRWIDTYAGYSDESELLLGLYTIGKKGYQLTHEDLIPYGGWPFPDRPPVWVNEAASLVMYWDTGIEARRMDWQTDDYYVAQAGILEEDQYQRLHLNEWISSISAFVPIEWWDRLAAPISLQGIGTKTPIVLGADASVTSDCTALVAAVRNPTNHDDVDFPYCTIWTPSPGHPMDYTNTLEAEIRRLCATYNVVQLAYDAYQLHKMATDLRNEGVVWPRAFSQAAERARADYQFFSMIRDKEIRHNGDQEFRQHIMNAGKKQSLEEDTKLRIVKRLKDNKIDASVAASMAASECRRLNL